MNYVPAGASWKQLVHFGQGYMHPGKYLYTVNHNNIVYQNISIYIK
jgi:hypothetical protein